MIYHSLGACQTCFKQLWQPGLSIGPILKSQLHGLTAPYCANPHPQVRRMGLQLHNVHNSQPHGPQKCNPTHMIATCAPNPQPHKPGLTWLQVCSAKWLF